MNFLPEDLLREIFRRTVLTERLFLRATCKRFRSLVDGDTRHTPNYIVYTRWNPLSTVQGKPFPVQRLLALVEHCTSSATIIQLLPPMLKIQWAFNADEDLVAAILRHNDVQIRTVALHILRVFGRGFSKNLQQNLKLTIN
jgi:hypothetical protein